MRINRGTGIVLFLLAIVLLPAIVWRFQSLAIAPDFEKSLRNGLVTDLPPDLRDKVWTDADMATIEVKMIPQGAGMERSISRSVHSQGEIMLSSNRYDYQASIMDTSTGIRHVFGHTRDTGEWRYERIHPDSEEQYIRQRQSEVEDR